jgi:hypothetical protein
MPVAGGRAVSCKASHARAHNTGDKHLTAP